MTTLIIAIGDYTRKDGELVRVIGFADDGETILTSDGGCMGREEVTEIFLASEVE
jgi:hypothetical protein